jgi:hypothetical protein
MIDTAAEHQRVGHRVADDRRAGKQQRGQHHGRDDGHRIGLEQVGRHARAVAHVVAHVVGDHRRVARVVLGDAGFDLAHQVGADIRALGEDAAAEAREDRDQRGAEREADQRLHDLAHLAAVRAGAVQEHEEARDRDEAQAHDQQAGDGAALEGDVERRADAAARRLGGAHVGAHRHVHADVAAAPEAIAPIAKPQRRVHPGPGTKPMHRKITTPTMPMVVYWRLR